MSDQNIAYHKVAQTTDIDDGEVIEVILGDKEIALYNIEGEFYATDNICTHAYAALSDGYVEGDIIECPLHGGKFEIKTGAPASAPCTEALKVYPVKIDGTALMVGISDD